MDTLVRAASSRKKLEQGLAARLVQAGTVDQAGLERALRLQASSEDRLEAILTKLGLASENDIAGALAGELSLDVAGPDDFAKAPVLETVNAKFLRRTRVLPLAETAEALVLAMADPTDAYAIRALEIATGKAVRVRVAAPSNIEAAFERLYETNRTSMGRIVDEIEEVQDDDASLDDIARLRDLASEAPVIRLVNLLITRAVESRASDIHIEPFQNRLAIRYRIDGMMREGPTPPPRLRAAIVSRIKIMAKLNIAERRLPQDGRIRIAVRGRDYDLRVATVPTLHGESVTIRILDRSSLVEDFEQLGFVEPTLSRFLDLLSHPQGILLVTGPTGSGKTTTLYTCMLRLNTPDKKLVTVEEPVEYQLEGVNQVQVRTQIGLTFAQVLRTLLRHNPDVIMIGEMRDLETAEVAIQSALTGHLVLSTLHTNNAASSITRLLDMKVEDYLVTSTVNGVLAQRLVRKLCTQCRAPYQAMPELIGRMGLQRPLGDERVTLYRAVGCELCHGTGYMGQTAVLELLVMSEAVRRLILNHAEAHEIHRVAVSEGMRSMYDDGVLKALAATTTMEEVLRVTRDV
jgi:general secretion pathway protein E